MNYEMSIFSFFGHPVKNTALCNRQVALSCLLLHLKTWLRIGGARCQEAQELFHGGVSVVNLLPCFCTHLLSSWSDFLFSEY